MGCEFALFVTSIILRKKVLSPMSTIKMCALLQEMLMLLFIFIFAFKDEIKNVGPHLGGGDGAITKRHRASRTEQGA